MSETIKTKLQKYIIDRAKYPNIPSNLDGEILLEQFEYGVITIDVESFTELLPQIKPDANDKMGYKKYIEKWKKEGINL